MNEGGGNASNAASVYEVPVDTLSVHNMARRATEQHQYHEQMGTYEVPTYEYATSGPNEQEVMQYSYIILSWTQCYMFIALQSAMLHLCAHDNAKLS